MYNELAGYCCTERFAELRGHAQEHGHVLLLDMSDAMR